MCLARRNSKDEEVHEETLREFHYSLLRQEGRFSGERPSNLTRSSQTTVNRQDLQGILAREPSVATMSMRDV